MAKSKRKPKPLSDQLRDIIRRSKLSRYRICQLADVDPSQLHRFVYGTGGLTTDSLDRIGQALRLRLVVDEDTDD